MPVRVQLPQTVGERSLSPLIQQYAMTLLSTTITRVPNCDSA